MDVNRDDAGRWQMEGEGAVVFTDTPSDGLFTLRRGKSITVRTLPAVPGAFSEMLALKGCRRMHQASETEELNLEMESVVPFGVKTVIEKELRMTPREMTVNVDFNLPHAFALEKLNAGGIAFSGRIRAFGFLPVPERAGTAAAFERKDFSSCKNGDVLYQGEFPLLSLVAEAEDGSMVEYRIGESIWRWINAPKLEGHSNYTLIRRDDELIYSWDLFTWDKPRKVSVNEEDPVPPFGRTWRLDWSLHWSSGDAKEIVRIEQCKDVFDCRSYPWQNSSLAQEKDGAVLKDHVCFSSPAVRNALKKWLRSQLADAGEGDVFGIAHAECGICFSSSHMQRAKYADLIHFNEPALHDFLRWANRQLASRGARCVLI